MSETENDTVNLKKTETDDVGGKWWLIRTDEQKTYTKVFVDSVKDGIVKVRYEGDSAPWRYMDAEEFFTKYHICEYPTFKANDTDRRKSGIRSDGAPEESDSVRVEFTALTEDGFVTNSFAVSMWNADEWLRKVGTKTTWNDIEDGLNDGYSVCLDLNVPNSSHTMAVRLSKANIRDCIRKGLMM